MQTCVLSVIREKDIQFQVPKHVDDPRTDYPHFFILVKKIVAVFVSIRLKYYCKIFRETKLDKKVRKKLSKLVLFKNQ